eukprot:TRINITY_DN6173_c0_g3_i3.p1 TRINITY_DN6173_c0_g3~~TRINITY_DN6173_c0_g3_i3.p1  ORF type:complete len:114 (-),score=27.84 TRINITY_DN6173_c0_g3_i3:122-463(-)
MGRKGVSANPDDPNDPTFDNPGDQIAARHDLFDPLDHRHFLNGAIDLKLVDAEHMRTKKVRTMNGPAAQDQPPFEWLPSHMEPHLYHPIHWNFGFISVENPFNGTNHSVVTAF